MREYVHETASGESASVNEIEVTMDHFERALDEVAAGTGSEDRELEEPSEAV